jgi:Methyltransferase domain
MASRSASAADHYTQGDYGKRHPDWHLADSQAKAADIDSALHSMLKDSSQSQWVIADVGAGAGGVLHETVGRMRKIRPDATVEGCGIEISAQAIELAATNFPELKMRQKFFDASDGPFDATMFIDVLEHLENPWQILRDARQVSRYLIVRQPLLENFSTFRHGNYRHQRDAWGHIGFFTYRFFLDMAHTAGWHPLHIELKAPWELHGMNRRASIMHRILTRANRVMASFILSGFYLNGVFKAE